MFALDGCAQSSGLKFTFTGDLGVRLSLGSSAAGVVGRALLPSDHPRPTVDRSCKGRGLRRIGLLFDDGVARGGVVVTAAIADDRSVRCGLSQSKIYFLQVCTESVAVLV